MLRGRLLYIELKSGMGDRGPAWIARAPISKSGRTVYFDGRALKSCGGQGVCANFYDLETGEEFWISGVKKTGCDRHWAGGGVVMIDSRVVDEYLAFRGLTNLDSAQYRVVAIQDTDVARFHEIENTRR